jgi:hypothetical protein
LFTVNPAIDPEKAVAANAIATKNSLVGLFIIIFALMVLRCKVNVTRQSLGQTCLFCQSPKWESTRGLSTLLACSRQLFSTSLSDKQFRACGRGECKESLLRITDYVGVAGAALPWKPKIARTRLLQPCLLVYKPPFVTALSSAAATTKKRAGSIH